MSRTVDDNTPQTCESEHRRHESRVLVAKPRPLTPALTVYRILPQKQLRMVGPWCFLDHFGPVATADYQQFDVAPHPHIGLQTITWLFSGQLVHQDSLGYEQPLRSGQLNLMTSGEGISHAEVADAQLNDPLHGLQLWSALPPLHERTEPRFDHYRQVPQFTVGDCTATLLVGEYRQQGQHYQSPALTFHPSLALLLSTARATATDLHLNKEHEYCIYVCQGRLDCAGTTVREHEVIQLGTDRSELAIELGADTSLIILGGEAFELPVKMWWNFVSSDLERVKQAQREWNEGHPRFGEVAHYQGERLLAPEYPQ